MCRQHEQQQSTVGVCGLRASTILTPSNIRGCKSGTWSAGLVYKYDYLWPLVCCIIRVGLLQNGASFKKSRSIETTLFSIKTSSTPIQDHIRSEEPAILAELVHLKEPSTSMGPEPAMDYVRHAVWGMLYADDAYIVSRSPQGLVKMMEVIVEVCQAFALTVSAKKTETSMCMPPPRTPRTMVRIEAAGQIYKQV